MENKYKYRLYSGAGFMLAAVAAGILIILYDLTHAQGYRNLQKMTLWVLMLYLVTPGLLAGVSGFLLGGDIFDRSKVATAKKAGVRGLVVSLAAWFVYAVVMAIVVESYPNNSSFIGTFILIVLFGSLVVGWLIALLGISTGILLFRLRESLYFEDQ